MKIRKEHFVQQANAFDDKLKGVISGFLTSSNFGLLPVWEDGEPSFKVVFKVDNQRFLKISVSRLSAVTRGGALMDVYNPDSPEELSVNISGEIDAVKKEDAGWYYIMLTVDPFNRQPSGILNEEEEPPRFPDAKPLISAYIVSEKEVARGGVTPNGLFIGKILIRPDRIELADDYVPPCMSVRSHQRLIDFYSQIEKFYNQMELNLLSIISKIREKGQDSALAVSVFELSMNLLTFISTNNLKIKWELPDQPPLHLFGNIAGFARIIRNTIDCNTAANKEELLNYFTNWSELKQGDFEKLLVYCINFEYNHNELSVSIDQFSEFLQIMNALFTKLESLAFIGKKKETQIFVKEQPVKRSFLLD